MAAPRPSCNRDRRKQPPAAKLAIDFPRLIAQLLAVDYRLAEISMYANIPLASLKDYRAGVHPLYAHGDRLIDLWAQAAEAPRDHVPRRAELPGDRRSAADRSAFWR